MIEIEFVLPEGMPPCPDRSEVDLDPGMYVRKRRLDGPRRPVLATGWGTQPSLFEARFAATKFRLARRGGDPRQLPGTLYLWLSAPQVALWQRQVGCPRCGAEVAEACIARGGVGPSGKGRFRSVDYVHKARRSLTDHFAIQIAPSIYPDWIWWATFAIGHDVHAVGACMLAAGRDADWIRSYLECFDAEVARGW